jgi:general L-amino acid transport system permease protein
MAQTDSFVPLPAREPPRRDDGPMAWVRQNFFADWKNTLLTLAVLALLALTVPPLLSWGVVNAVTGADNDACRAAYGSGACWGVVAEKGRLIVFGRYPFDEQWRPVVACALLVALLVCSCLRRFWKVWLALAWVVVLAVFFALMRGGVFGLTPVETERWGGVPLTLLLSIVSLVIAFPLSVLVALGRQSNLPAIRTLCVIYVELIRGVPLISVLFMASFILPLFMPTGSKIDVHDPVQCGLPGRGGARRPAGLAQGAGRGGAVAGPVVLADAAPDRAAAGAAHGGAGHRQHLHRRLQGHLACHHREPVRPDRRGAARAG